MQATPEQQHYELVHMVENMGAIIVAILMILLFIYVLGHTKAISREMADIFKRAAAYIVRMFTYKSGHGNHATARIAGWYDGDRPALMPHEDLRGHFLKSETGGYHYVPVAQ